MTAVSTPSPSTATASTATAATSGRLRTLLLVDGTGTTALGVVALVAAGPLSDVVGTPTLLRLVGVLFVVVGVDMLLTRRLAGRRLRVAAQALAAADLAFAAATAVALLAVGAPAAGTALVLAVAGVCVGMGTAKLRLAAALG